MPPPDPRSRTRSPSWSSATAIGLPQPSEARTAALRQLGALERGVELGADRLRLGGAAASCARLDRGCGVVGADLLVDRLGRHRGCSSSAGGGGPAKGAREAVEQGRACSRRGRSAAMRARWSCSDLRSRSRWTSATSSGVVFMVLLSPWRGSLRPSSVLILDDIDICQYPIWHEACSTDPDALLLQGAADPTRLAILRQLAGGDEVCACDFTACCDVAQPTVSHHLKVLREAGWVTSERRASCVYYRLRPEAVERFRAIAGELAPVLAPSAGARVAGRSADGVATRSARPGRSSPWRRPGRLIPARAATGGRALKGSGRGRPGFPGCRP